MPKPVHGNRRYVKLEEKLAGTGVSPSITGEEPDHKKVLPPAVPVGTSGGRTFAEPISLSSTVRIDFRLPATALTIGFGLLASRTRRKEDNKVVPSEIQGLRSAEK
jgi:hypothetical protein